MLTARCRDWRLVYRGRDFQRLGKKTLTEGIQSFRGRGRRQKISSWRRTGQGVKLVPKLLGKRGQSVA